jgi:CIC family chloride channel protein
MGAGYDSMDQAMHGQFVWQVLIVLGLLKIVATSLSASSGAPGGMFAPALFVGAMIGAAVGTLQHRFFPSYTGPLGSYALVGMGTLFAGFLRAPLTSVFMVLEVSGNYSIILPVMISNAIAYLIGRHFQPIPIFDMITRDEGLDLPSMEEDREQVTLLVEVAMRKPAVVVLQASETVEAALPRIRGIESDEFLVSFATGRWALARRSTLEEAAKSGKGALPLAELVSSSRSPRLHPDQSLDLALRLMRDAPFLPVVHRADARRLLGVLSLDDILAAYRRASVVGGPHVA